MCKDKEPLLNDIEKKKILETVEIIHQVTQEVSTKKKSIGQILKHPLILLFAGSLISGMLLFQYQKQYESTAERVNAKYDLSTQITDKIFSITGKVHSTAKIIVELHSKKIGVNNQIINANKAYNEASSTFISNFPKIRFKLKIAFKNDKVNRWWNGIQNRIDELDKLLNLLLKFPTVDTSEIHSERIVLCEKKIEEIESELNLGYDFVFEAFE